MNIFLVDTENISFSLSDKDMKDSKIVYFLRADSSDKTKKAFEKLTSVYKEKITVVYCSSGSKDAVDIQLSYYFGQNSNSMNSYYIVSRDKGYDSMIKFAKTMNINVSRIDKNTVSTTKKCKDSGRLEEKYIGMKNDDMKKVYLYIIKKYRPNDLDKIKNKTHKIDRRHAIKSFARLLRKYKKLNMTNSDELAGLMGGIDFGNQEQKLRFFKILFTEKFGTEEFAKINQENTMKMISCLL